MKYIATSICLLIVSYTGSFSLVHAQTEQNNIIIEKLLAEIEANLELAAETADDENRPDQLKTILDEIQAIQQSILFDLETVEHESVHDTVRFLESGSEALDEAQLLTQLAIEDTRKTIKIDIPTAATKPLPGQPWSYNREIAKNKRNKIRQQNHEAWRDQLALSGLSDEVIHEKISEKENEKAERKIKRQQERSEIKAKVEAKKITPKQIKESFRRHQLKHFETKDKLPDSSQKKPIKTVSDGAKKITTIQKAKKTELSNKKIRSDIKTIKSNSQKARTKQILQVPALTTKKRSDVAPATQKLQKKRVEQEIDRNNRRREQKPAAKK